jgi:hypothetical protein
MKEAKLFFLPIQSMCQGSYGVYEMPENATNNMPVRVKPTDVIFLADGSIAGDYVALGVIQKMMKEEKNVGIACNPGDMDDLGGKDGERTIPGE